MCNPGNRRENLHHVGDGRAARGGDDADAPWKAGQRPFPLGGEQPLGGQFLLELLECQLERAQTLRFEQFHYQLVFATLFVDIDAPARQHGQSIPRAEFPIAMRRTEGHALHRGIVFFEGEIVVAARGRLESRNFSRDPNFSELLVEQRADRSVQFADREDAALRDEVELECELLQGIMVAR